MNESKLKYNNIYMNSQILTLKEIINIVEILIWGFLFLRFV